MVPTLFVSSILLKKVEFSTSLRRVRLANVNWWGGWDGWTTVEGEVDLRRRLLDGLLVGVVLVRVEGVER
jgi:uncharacterized membrane protein